MKESEAKERIAELSRLIAHYNKLYYIDDNPSIEDAEYDALMRELGSLEKEHPSLAKADSPTRTVGTAAASRFEKFKHPYPMFSLSNVMNEDEFLEFHRRMQKDTGALSITYTIEEKFDGLAVELIYHGGKFATGSTRGDGHEGELITANIMTISNVPKTIAEKKELIVRGEVLLTKAEFERINREREEADEPLFANPRNAAAGSLRVLDANITKGRKLRFFAYQVANYREVSLTGEAATMDYLKKLGFEISDRIRTVDSPEAVLAMYRDFEAKRRELAYEIDGLVIKVDDHALQEKLGVVSRSPRYAVAFKFKPVEAMSVIEEIVIQVGRTGALTPVAKIRPVPVGGVIVSSVTLHNPDEIKAKDIRVSDTVAVVRAGDVIPKILRVDIAQRRSGTEPYHFPDRCPVCNGETAVTEGEVIVRCINDACPAKILKTIEHFVSKDCMNIEGLGKEFAAELVTKGLVKDFADIYRLTGDDLFTFERMGDKLRDKLLTAIEKSKRTTLSRFICALGIRHVGEETAALLAKRYKSIDAVMTLTHDDLISMDSIGEEGATSIVSYFSDRNNRALIKGMLSLGVTPSHEEIIAVESPLTGKNVVITGSIEGYTRSQAKEAAERMGANVQSAVSKTTDILIAGEAAGSKLKKAAELGTKIIDAPEFVAIIKKHM
ncbi:MAG: NAD-dependent DNA ligase LigA [Spirochaetota bacterium]|mgnify:CR=1 FL=1